jgi:hypothetical protein
MTRTPRVSARARAWAAVTRRLSVTADKERMMHTHNGRGSRGKSPAKRRPLPEQTAESFALALKWREEWRASKSGAPARTADIALAAAPGSGADQNRHRAQFAQAITRLEFGRSYWDERLQRASQKSGTGSREPVRNGSG